MSIGLLRRLRAALYPGLDLHTRNRASLKVFWSRGERDVLDAGCGNGYFAWLAYRSGARVVALNIDSAQLRKASDLLFDVFGVQPSRLRFEHANLYALDKEQRRFDEIICYEVLEHLRDDKTVLRQFHRLLRPGGSLHLCCPNRLHPRHIAEVLDDDEQGGHVRPGYIEQEYRDLLEPLGFSIRRVVGIGPMHLYYADAAMRFLRHHLGDWAALPLLPLALPLVWGAGFNPQQPFSLYVQAVKTEGQG